MRYFWSRWKQPWSKDQCRRRYVEGDDDIGIRQLAKDSGQPKGTVETWSKTNDWVGQRRRFRDDLQTEVREKTIEKTSDKLSDELSNIAIANYEAHQQVRDYALSVFRIRAKHMNSIQELPDDRQLEEVKKHLGSEMNYWSQILKRATEGIESATGLPYWVNVNTSIRRVEREGLHVSQSEPTEE